MKIKDVMNKAVAIDQNISLKEAAKIMSDKNIGSLIAVKNGKVFGILTEHDVVSNISGLDKKVSSIMAKKVTTIDSNKDINEAAIIMAENKIKRLPVLAEGDLVGVITVTDIIAHSKDLDDEFIFE